MQYGAIHVPACCVAFVYVSPWLLWALLLPQVVAKKYRSFEIPADMTGVWRYLNQAYEREEFINTCPAEREIEFAYLDVAKKIK